MRNSLIFRVAASIALILAALALLTYAAGTVEPAPEPAPVTTTAP